MNVISIGSNLAIKIKMIEVVFLFVLHDAWWRKILFISAYFLIKPQSQSKRKEKMMFLWIMKEFDERWSQTVTLVCSLMESFLLYLSSYVKPAQGMQYSTTVTMCWNKLSSPCGVHDQVNVHYPVPWGDKLFVCLHRISICIFLTEYEAEEQHKSMTFAKWSQWMEAIIRLEDLIRTQQTLSPSSHCFCNCASLMFFQTVLSFIGSHQWTGSFLFLITIVSNKPLASTQIHFGHIAFWLLLLLHTATMLAASLLEDHLALS